MADGTECVWVGSIGNNGQRLWIVPGLDMVVVTTVGDCSQRAIWKQAETLLNEVITATQSTSH